MGGLVGDLLIYLISSLVSTYPNIIIFYLFFCPQVAPGEREAVRGLVKRVMEGAGGGLISVPLTIDISEGSSWAL